MESQKIINLLNSNDTESQKFATKRWYIIHDQSSGGNPYGHGTDSVSIKYDTTVIKANLCDYSDAYILVTGNIQSKLADSTVAFKNCAPFRTCNVNINDEYVEKAEYLDIIMPMYNLLEHSDNYEDATGSLYQFKRDEPPPNNAEVTAGTKSLKYKSITDDNNDDDDVVKLVVPLKYISSFFRSSEMPLVNCKVDLEPTWHKDCVISSADTAGNNVVSFRITDTKLYMPIATLSTKDNTNLTKQLNEGFKRTVYWNRYKAIPYTGILNGNNPHTKTLDASFEGVNRLFVLGCATGNNEPTQNGYRTYYLPRINITDYNVRIDGRNFYDQPINSLIRQYDEIRKIATGKGDNYATGCLLDYKYFTDFYKLVAIDLSKQKELDADPRAIHQIKFIFRVSANAFVLAVLEKSKETVLEFYKGIAKVM